MNVQHQLFSFLPGGKGICAHSASMSLSEKWVVRLFRSPGLTVYAHDYGALSVCSDEVHQVTSTDPCPLIAELKKPGCTMGKNCGHHRGLGFGGGNWVMGVTPKEGKQHMQRPPPPIESLLYMLPLHKGFKTCSLRTAGLGRGEVG